MNVRQGFSDAPASLALMIVCDWLTDSLIETGDWQFCMFDSSRTTPLVFYPVGVFVWSVRSVFRFYLAHLWTDFQSCLLLFALLQKIKEILLPPVGNWATVCTFENIFTPWVLVLKIPSFKTVALPPKVKNGKVEKQFAQILIYTFVFSGDLNFLPLLLIPTSINWKPTARWWTPGL